MYIICHCHIIMENRSMFIFEGIHLYYCICTPQINDYICATSQRHLLRDKILTRGALKSRDGNILRRHPTFIFELQYGFSITEFYYTRLLLNATTRYQRYHPIFKIKIGISLLGNQKNQININNIKYVVKKTFIHVEIVCC